ncbi:hypothetical protein ECTW09195_6073, partial [Escherichia coli TW09195]
MLSANTEKLRKKSIAQIL